VVVSVTLICPGALMKVQIRCFTMNRTLIPRYKKHKIALQALEQNAGQWIGEYGIIEAPRELIAANKERTGGTHPSREEAEAAGLKKARRIIDSRKRSKQGNDTRSCVLREPQSGRYC
ncbi:MAG TPA: hypothetical protein VFU48_10510, partial [Nitrospira sp.]|nr:hypothetical protein [Nitrospira sp.]